MVKLVTFLKWKTRMPTERFQSYLRIQQPAAVTRLPRVRRYVQSHALPAPCGTDDPA